MAISVVQSQAFAVPGSYGATVSLPNPVQAGSVVVAVVSWPNVSTTKVNSSAGLVTQKYYNVNGCAVAVLSKAFTATGAYSDNITPSNYTNGGGIVVYEVAGISATALANFTAAIAPSTTPFTFNSNVATQTQETLQFFAWAQSSGAYNNITASMPAGWTIDASVLNGASTYLYGLVAHSDVAANASPNCALTINNNPTTSTTAPVLTVAFPATGGGGGSNALVGTSAQNEYASGSLSNYAGISLSGAASVIAQAYGSLSVAKSLSGISAQESYSSLQVTPAFNIPQVLQSTGKVNSNGSTTSVFSLTNVTPGSALIIELSTYYIGLTISAPGFTVITTPATIGGQSINGQGTVLYLLNSAGGNVSVTVTASTSTYFSGAMLEVANLGSAPVIDFSTYAMTKNTTSATLNPNGSNTPTSQQNDLCVGVLFGGNGPVGVTTTFPSGWTNTFTENASGNQTGFGGYYVQPTAGVPPSSFTVTQVSGGDVGALLVTFKAAPGSSTVPLNVSSNAFGSSNSLATLSFSGSYQALLSSSRSLSGAQTSNVSVAAKLFQNSFLTTVAQVQNPTFVAAGAYAAFDGGGPGTINVPVPTNATNDVLICIFSGGDSSKNTAFQVSAPAGWQVYTYDDFTTAYWGWVSAIAVKVSSGTEPATYPFALQSAGSNQSLLFGQMFSFRGCDSTNPISDAKITTLFSGTTIQAPSVQPTTAKDTLFTFFFNESTTDIPSLPTGFTNINAQGATIGAAPCGWRSAYLPLSSSDATGIVSSTVADPFSSGSDQYGGGFAISLRGTAPILVLLSSYSLGATSLNASLNYGVGARLGKNTQATASYGSTLTSTATASRKAGANLKQLQLFTASSQKAQYATSQIWQGWRASLVESRYSNAYMLAGVHAASHRTTISTASFGAGLTAKAEKNSLSFGIISQLLLHSAHFAGTHSARGVAYQGLFASAKKNSVLEAAIKMAMLQNSKAISSRTATSSVHYGLQAFSGKQSHAVATQSINVSLNSQLFSTRWISATPLNSGQFIAYVQSGFLTVGEASTNVRQTAKIESHSVTTASILQRQLQTATSSKAAKSIASVSQYAFFGARSSSAFSSYGLMVQRLPLLGKSVTSSFAKANILYGINAKTTNGKTATANTNNKMFAFAHAAGSSYTYAHNGNYVPLYVVGKSVAAKALYGNAVWFIPFTASLIKQTSVNLDILTGLQATSNSSLYISTGISQGLLATLQSSTRANAVFGEYKSMFATLSSGRVLSADSIKGWNARLVGSKNLNATAATEISAAGYSSSGNLAIGVPVVTVRMSASLSASTKTFASMTYIAPWKNLATTKFVVEIENDRFWYVEFKTEKLD